MYLIRLTIRFGVIMAISLAIIACGKKGPPLPPLAQKPPVAMKLQLDSMGRNVVLRWKIAPAATGQVKVFEILVAATALDPGRCDGCPLIFQTLGKVRFQKGRLQYRFRAKIRPGFKYTYKIRSLGKARGLISDSEPVTFQVTE